MSKNDFLNNLKLALNGKVSYSLVQENMAYYSEYIDSQLRMGRSEEEVMDMLGDPRLIARTIVQTNGTETVEEGAYQESTTYDDTAYGSGAYGGTSYHGYNKNPDEYDCRSNEVRVRSIPTWLWMIIVVLIIVCVIGFVFSVVSFLLPFVLPVLVVMFFVKLFRDWLN